MSVDEAKTPRISEAAPVYARAAQELALDLSTACVLYQDAKELHGALARAKAYSCLFLAVPQAPPQTEERRMMVSAFLAFHEDARRLLSLLADVGPVSP